MFILWVLYLSKVVPGVTDVYRKYAWVVPLKNEKGITNINASKRILHKSRCKSNKIWVDKCSGFYNQSVKSWLQNNDLEMYSKHNKAKSVVAKVMFTSYCIGFCSVSQHYTVWYEHNCLPEFMLSMSLKTLNIILMCFGREGIAIVMTKNAERIKNWFLLDRWWNTVSSFIG